MKTTRISPAQRQFGQGMTEYIIIVIVVAIAAIGVYMYFGQTVRQDVAGMAKEMAGQDSTEARTGAKTAADTAQKQEADTTKGLSSYENPK